MNIVEKEALKYVRDITNIVATLSNVKNKLSSKLYDFNRDKDKLYFLSVLRNSIYQEKVEHEKHCKGCAKSDNFNVMLFVIDQEYESIDKYFEPEIQSQDQFTSEEKFNIHNKINEILDNLQYLKNGQEIIFDEVDTLRQHFNLGKKSWFQLLRSKLVDVCVTTALEKSVAENIYNTLANEVDVTNLLGF